MSKPIIEIRGIGKLYRLGATQEKYLSVRDELVRRLSPAARRAQSAKSEFWAIRDIAFDVQPGEAIGIIGRNGAGKSTLLKVLSQITTPTTGEITVRGRVASLLEVGTGFHPELSGRENIYLNGAILGMTRREIARKFDEIVEFAEITKFLDTPVKRYSSGMYVRLAFAVAAHLEPEILIVDEVLAVGDVEFQKKCLGKMNEVARGGRTVIFVSHNMTAVAALCQRGIYLKNGSLFLDDEVNEVIHTYSRQADDLLADQTLADRTDRSGSGEVCFTDFRVRDMQGNLVTSLQSGKDYSFELDYLNRTGQPLKQAIISLDIFDERSNRLLLLRTNFTDQNVDLSAHAGTVHCQIADLPLANGAYTITLWLGRNDHESLDVISEAGKFYVEGGDYFGTGSPGLPRYCRMLYRADWSTEADPLFGFQSRITEERV